MESHNRIFNRLLLLLVIISLLTQTSIPALAFSPPADVGKRMVIDVPFFSQVAFRDTLDPNNKPYLLGNSGILLWTDGCAVASLAMVYNKWGMATCLPCLNESLKISDGFSGPLIKFGDSAALAKAGAPFIKGVVRQPTSRPQDYKEKVTKELEAGHPVIAFINNAHFVVITGIDEKGSYLVNDSWKSNEAEGKNIPIEENLTGLGFDKITQFVFVYPSDNAPTNNKIVRGLIRDAYFAQGGSKGILGDPISDDTEDTMFNDQFHWQKFEHGVLIEVQGEVFSIYGPLWKKVQDLGGLEKTGLPLSSQYSYWSFGHVKSVVDLESMTLRWSDDKPENQVEVLYPGDAIRTEYFSNNELEGNPIHIGLTNQIKYDWGDSTPINLVNPDKFSIRWTGEIKSSSFVGWFYTFQVNSDGRYRVTIDGKLVLDAWNQKTGKKFTLYLGKGKHTFSVDYAKNSKNASISFGWTAWPVSPALALGNDYDGPVDYMPSSITTYLGQSSSQNTTFTEPDQPVRELMDAISVQDEDRALLALVPSDRSFGKILVSAFQSATELNNKGGSVEFDEMEYSVNMGGEENALVTVDGIADLYNADHELTDSRSFIFEIPVIKKDQSWYVSLDLAKVYELLKEYQKSQ